jgi:4-oxalocrotonate tautomerase
MRRPNAALPVTRGFTRPEGIVGGTGITDGRRTKMPLVTVKVIEGVFTQEQKREMIKKITDTMVEIEGENLRPVTWVLVEEVCSGDWGIAGNGLTTTDVHALQAQPLAAAVG